MKKKLWLALLIFCFGFSGCACMPSFFKCGQTVEETPPPAAVVSPAPTPAPVYTPAPMPKKERN